MTSSVPVVVTTPTKTLYATDCTGSINQESTTLASSLTSNAFVTTSVLVESTLPPSTFVMESSATLADGSVVETVVTFMSTLPATQVYVPSMVPTSTASHGSKTNAMPIVASVLGGFFGLIAIVAFIWWFCRRRRYSWDDIFEKEDYRDNHDVAAPIPIRRQRDHSKLDLSAEPKPYQYGLVGHVVAPAESGSPPGSPRTLPHSRNTSLSAVPLLEGSSLGRASRPTTAETVQFGQMQRETVHGHSSANTRISNYSISSSAPLIDVQSNTHTTSNSSRSGHGGAAGSLDGSDRPISPMHERRVLQVINDHSPSSPTTPRPNASKTHVPSGSSGNVIIHTDGGRVAGGSSSEPPPYSL